MKTQTHTEERWTYETDWSDVVTNQGIPRVVSNHQKLGKCKKGSVPRAWWGSVPCWNLGFKLPAPQTVGEYSSVVLNTSFWSFSCRRLRKYVPVVSFFTVLKYYIFNRQHHKYIEIQILKTQLSIFTVRRTWFNVFGSKQLNSRSWLNSMKTYHTS